MATSSVEIANLALARIGVKVFLKSFNDDSTEAEVMTVIYNQTRDALLASFAWPFATRRATLTAITGGARNGWAYSSGLPSDFVSAQGLWSGNRNTPVDLRTPYQIESNDAGNGIVILTDSSAESFFYTARITNVAVYPPLFVDALAWALAKELVLSLPVKPQMMDMVDRQLQMALGRAKRAAMQEGQTDIAPESEFITVRG